MEHSPLRTLGLAVAAVIIVGLAAYAYINRAQAPSQSTEAATTTSQNGVSGLPAGSVVTEVPITPAPQAPDYNKPVAYSPDTTPEVTAAIERRLAADRSALKQNSQNFNAWMDLAILYKMGGDYEGAESIWLYATKVWPTNYVAYHNLADLYRNFLKDSAKAKIYADLEAKYYQTP